jgi:hypothetical protein
MTHIHWVARQNKLEELLRVYYESMKRKLLKPIYEKYIEVTGAVKKRESRIDETEKKKIYLRNGVGE